MTVPMIDLRQQNPLVSGLQSMLNPVATGVRENIQDNQLRQVMQSADSNSPTYIQDLLNKSPAHLRPQISSMLKEQLQLQTLSEDATRKRESFERQKKLQDMKIGEAELAQDQRFTDLVGTKLGKDTDDFTKAAFTDLSKKYANEMNPETRYQKTLKDYTRQLQSVGRVRNKIDKVSKFRKGFVGLAENDINAISEDIQRLKKEGIDDRIIKNMLGSEATGISERDYDAMTMPNYKQVNKIMKSMKLLSFEEGAGRGQKALSSEGMDTLTSKVAAAVKRGGSLDFIFTELMNKGYSDDIANQVIREVAVTADLTQSQQVQLNNLVQKRQQTLGRIFGV